MESTICDLLCLLLLLSVFSRLIHIAAGIRTSFIMSNIPFYINTRMGLSVHPPLNIWVVSIRWLLWITLLGLNITAQVFAGTNSVISGGIFGHMVSASLVAQRLKRLPPTRETRVWSLGREDSLEKEMVTHPSILAWRIPRTEKPGGLQSTGSQRVRHDWATSLHFRYTDDTTLMAESEELKSLLMKVKEESENVGLKLNIQKTKIMASGPTTSWQIDRATMETVRDFILGDSGITADGDYSHEIKTLAPWKKSYDQPRDHIKRQRHYFANKGPSSQSYGFSSGHVWMWELDYKESWAPKN